MKRPARGQAGERGIFMKLFKIIDDLVFEAWDTWPLPLYALVFWVLMPALVSVAVTVAFAIIFD